MFFALPLWAQQNLVPNPSFEQVDSCQPWSMEDVFVIQEWYNPTPQATPDYYNACTNGLGLGAGVPLNDAGYQEAYEGNAYIGIGVYLHMSFPSQKEYMQVHLVEPLQSGETYYWCMRVSLCDKCGIATNKTGIGLSVTPVTNNSGTTLLPVSFISYSDSIVADTQNWVLLHNRFVADSAYEYLTIGNFLENGQTDILVVSDNNGAWSLIGYYYIDNIYLSTTPCFKATETPYQSPEIPNIFTPNGDGVNDAIDFSRYIQDKGSVEIYNRWGNLVFEGSAQNGYVWQGDRLNAGVYFYIIRSENTLQKGTIQLIR